MDVVTFFIDQEEFAVDIRQVEEVMQMQEIFPIPDTEDCVAGVIVLRKNVIPVVHVRVKLGIEIAEFSRRTRIIVAKILSGSYLGFIVDQTGDMYKIAPESVERVDGVLRDNSYLLGIIKQADKVVRLIDLEELIKADSKDIVNHVMSKVQIKKT